MIFDQALSFYQPLKSYSISSGSKHSPTKQSNISSIEFPALIKQPSVKAYTVLSFVISTIKLFLQATPIGNTSS